MGSDLFLIFAAGVVMIFLAGFYCLIVTHNLVRALIGLEILTKGVTLLLIVSGHATGQMALAQALAITLIVIEVAVVVVAAGLILAVYRKNKSIDVRLLRNIKG